MAENKIEKSLHILLGILKFRSAVLRFFLRSNQDFLEVVLQARRLEGDGLEERT